MAFSKVTRLCLYALMILLILYTFVLFLLDKDSIAVQRPRRYEVLKRADVIQVRVLRP